MNITFENKKWIISFLTTAKRYNWKNPIILSKGGDAFLICDPTRFQTIRFYIGTSSNDGVGKVIYSNLKNYVGMYDSLEVKEEEMSYTFPTIFDEYTLLPFQTIKDATAKLSVFPPKGKDHVDVSSYEVAYSYHINLGNTSYIVGTNMAAFGMVDLHISSSPVKTFLHKDLVKLYEEINRKYARRNLRAYYSGNSSENFLSDELGILCIYSDADLRMPDWSRIIPIEDSETVGKINIREFGKLLSTIKVDKEDKDKSIQLGVGKTTMSASYNQMEITTWKHNKNCFPYFNSEYLQELCKTFSNKEVDFKFIPKTTSNYLYFEEPDYKAGIVGLAK